MSSCTATRGAKGRAAIKDRILTGIIALPALILYIYFASPFFFTFLVFVVALLALSEFFRMALPPERFLEGCIATLSGALLTLAVASQNFALSLGALSVLLIFWLTWFLFSFRELSSVMQQIGLVFLGFVYLSLPLAHLAALRDLEFGRQWIFLVLLLVMASDTAAYFVGVSLGRRKLYPAISPNKSVEGALGGLAGALGGVVVAKYWFLPVLSLVDCFLLAAILGPLAQVGDLVESMLKRSFGVKDSGSIIPGHGGILDRLDSLLLVFPPVFYFALLKGF